MSRSGSDNLQSGNGRQKYAASVFGR